MIFHILKNIFKILSKPNFLKKILHKLKWLPRITPKEL